MKEEYVPIDFNAYTIEDQTSKSIAELRDETLEKAKKNQTGESAIDPAEKMWRISSLTASVDDETRILVVPLPESKRKVKVADTKYNAKTYTELYNLIMSAEEQLSPETDGSAKRFDDKTEEELEEEMARKRKQ